MWEVLCFLKAQMMSQLGNNMLSPEILGKYNGRFRVFIDTKQQYGLIVDSGCKVGFPGTSRF